MESDWSQAAESYRLHLVEEARSGETIRTYVAYVGIVWRWMARREIMLVEADRVALAHYLEESSRRYSRNTVRNCICALGSFYRFCVMKGWRQDDPTEGISRKKPKHKPRRPFGEAELRAMYQAAEAPVDKALLLSLAGTAMRIGEAVGLRIENIDHERHEALIRGKGDKERWIVFTEAVSAAVSAYVGNRKSGPVFLCEDGRPMNRERARKRLVKLAARASVVGCYPHRFRTSYANSFLQAGGDLGALQVIMGHSDIATTAKYAAYSQAQRALDQMRNLDLAGKLLS